MTTEREQLEAEIAAPPAPPAPADNRLVPMELLERLMADIESHNYGFDGLQELRALMEHPK